MIPAAGEDDGKKHTYVILAATLFIISAEGGNDEQCSEAEKIAGSAMI